MIAFAGNSVLCRLALGSGASDAASFTTIRLLSGAVVLAFIGRFPLRRKAVLLRGNWLSAGALFCYAAAFSYAYLSLSTGTGALILFGAVQLTMIIAALRSGERMTKAEIFGTLSAFAGLVYLVSPGVTAPSFSGALLMAGAGISWGIYSLRGRRSVNPLAETAKNFLLTLPFVAGLSLILLHSTHLNWKGALLAVVSGGLASGVGYAVWYAALMGLTATRASIVQLTVPVLAAMGGVMFLGEEISLRLLLSATAVLGGVGLAVVARIPRR